jgi:hypothetical protein
MVEEKGELLLLLKGLVVGEGVGVDAVRACGQG